MNKEQLQPIKDRLAYLEEQKQKVNEDIGALVTLRGTIFKEIDELRNQALTLFNEYMFEEKKEVK